MNKIIKTFYFIALFFNSSIFAESTHYLLPINIASTPKVNLSITAPDNFHSLQPPESLASQKSYILEYVPNGENGNNWSEIVTLFFYRGLQITSKNSVDYFINTISKLSNAKVLLNQTVEKENYQISSFVISYNLNGKHEVLVGRFYSGPLDQAGIQYTIRPKKGTSDSKALKKIKDFLDKNVSIVTATPSENS